METWVFVFFMKVCTVFPMVSPGQAVAYDCKAPYVENAAVSVTVTGTDILWDVGPVQTDGDHVWARVTFRQDMSGQFWGEGRATITYYDADRIFADGF